MHLVGLLVFVFYVTFFAVDIATGREDWPFGSYSMFSRVQARTSYAKYVVVGVRGGSEVPLAGHRSISSSFEGRDNQPLNRVLSRFALFDTSADARAKLLTAFLKAHPDFKTARLYRLTWRLESPATPERELLLEVNG